jgi:hypothetical protein
MTPTEYLQKILGAQTLDPFGPEVADMQRRRDSIEATLKRKFPDSEMTIRYAGSHAKGTMIKEAYDLDIACYLAHEDETAGETLADIFTNVRKALETDYRVRPKTSALRVRSKDKDSLDLDFHIDVVPGRFTGFERGDAFLHIGTREKSRLKTNLDVHVNHIRYSGCLDEVRLMKLWNLRTGLQLKTFVLELVTIKVLSEADAPFGLDARLRYVLEFLRDNAETFTVEDPANPTGNDLSEYLDDSMRARTGRVAARTIRTIHEGGWEGVFGSVDEPTKGQRAAAVITASRTHPTPVRPWRSMR